MNAGAWAESSEVPEQFLEKWNMKKTLWLAVALLAVPHLFAQNVPSPGVYSGKWDETLNGSQERGSQRRCRVGCEGWLGQ